MVNPHDLRWLNPPPTRRLQIYSPPPRDTLRVILAGPGRALYTHDTMHGAVPCTCPLVGLTPQCPFEADLVVYLPAVCFDSRRLILELSGSVLHDEPGLLHQEVTGLWARVKRLGRALASPAVFALLRGIPRALNVIPFDPLPRLLEAWTARLRGQPDGDDQAAGMHWREGGPQG